MGKRTNFIEDKDFYKSMAVVAGIALLPMLVAMRSDKNRYSGKGKDGISDAGKPDDADESIPDAGRPDYAKESTPDAGRPDYAKESTPDAHRPDARLQAYEARSKRGKTGHFAYIFAVLLLCLMPLLAIGKSSAGAVAEKKEFAEIPKPFDENGFRWEYFGELGRYFDERFAFRPELAAFDAMFRTSVFGVSPIDDVIAGENGWLYYADTLDDFQHKNPISDRMLFNIAHNLSMMQSYTQNSGAEFIFTVAPNKNSLYDENMPQQLRYQVESESDMDRLRAWLQREQINYVDLYNLFEEKNEVLYYKRDSHWNSKGAVMVYDALLNAYGKPHETYEDSSKWVSGSFYGDLDRMLFPIGSMPETELQHPGSNAWTYVQGETVEDDLIVTECADGSQTLLMYRDSFGNSLLPLMADEFSQAVFSKNVPYPMTDLETYNPDILIVERVERHLPGIAKAPPKMNAPEAALSGTRAPAAGSTTASVSKEGGFWVVSGVADMNYMSDDSRVFVEMTDDNGTKTYEAFCANVGNDASDDYGYILYLSEDRIAGEPWQINVLTERDGGIFVLKEETLKEPESEEPKAKETETKAEEKETAETKTEKKETAETKAEKKETAETKAEEKETAETKTEKKETAETKTEKKETAETKAEKKETKETQAQEPSQAQAEKAQPEEPKTPASPPPEQPAGGATVVNRVYIEDCGSDSGYWEITYSDGHVEYVEE